MEDNTTRTTTEWPLLIFVLGAPCSGKSTLCRALVSEYHLEHFSLGDELRDLIQEDPMSRAALVKPTLSPEEIHIFIRCVTENTLGPRELTTKYVAERLFGVGAGVGQVRVLVDGFPRDLDRWECLKEMAGECFAPAVNTFVIVLNIDLEEALARYEARGSPGDEFVRRFSQHDTHAWSVRNAMQLDGVQCLDLHVGRDYDPTEDVVEFLRDRMDEWASMDGDEADWRGAEDAT